MKKSSENNHKDQLDAKIIDKLYLEGAGVKNGEIEGNKTSFDETREVEELKKALNYWRDNHSEEEPSSVLRHKILQEAVKEKESFSLKRFFLIPIKVPAIGIAVCVLIIFSFVTYKYILIKTPEKNYEDRNEEVSRKKDDIKRDDSLAMSKTDKVLERSVREAFPEEEREEEDLMLADKTLEETSRDVASKTIDETYLPKSGKQLLDREDEPLVSQEAVRSRKERNIQDREVVAAEATNSQRRKRKFSSTTLGRGEKEKGNRVSRGAGGLGKQGSKGYSGLPSQKSAAPSPGAPAASSIRDTSRGITDQITVEADGKDAVVGGVEKKEEQKKKTDFFQQGILEQKRQNHVQAVKFFEKALEKATESAQKNRILLKMAESEIKKGNKKKAKHTLAKIKNRKGWVGKEAQRLERKVQTRKTKKKPKQRKKSTSD